MATLHTDIRAIQSRRELTITEECINADLPATSDPHILATLESICTANHIPYQKMVARAYHDTNFIAPIAPVAMLFIPCRNGVSHRPDEYSTPESIALGTRVLAQALAKTLHRITRIHHPPSPNAPLQLHYSQTRGANSTPSNSSLPTTHYPLLTTHYPLLTTHYPLLHYPLPTAL